MNVSVEYAVTFIEVALRITYMNGIWIGVSQRIREMSEGSDTPESFLSKVTFERNLARVS